MSSIFKQLLNVKGTVVEDVRIVDSPLRPEPVLEVRVRPRAGALRCSRCGRRHRGYDQGGGVRRWRGQDFGLLARRTGRRHAARGLPEVRRRGRLRVFCQVGVGRFGVSFSPCERRVSGRFGVGRSCWLLVIALVIA